MKYLLIIAFFIFIGCASKPNNEGIVKLRLMSQKGDYGNALKLLKTDKEMTTSKNSLLLSLNKGSIYHLQKQYHKATEYFQKAITIIEKLYTKKISKKIATLITNETADIYYGEKFEHSMVYYYLAIDYYLLSKQFTIENPSKSQEYRNMARATLRGWDVFLDNLRRDRVGESIFKRDLAQHLIGAALHQTLGSREDLQIALVLYQNVFDVLKKSYNTYPSFNINWKKYRHDYAKLKSLSKQKLEKYIKETLYQNKLTAFVRKRLLLLARQINKKRFRSIAKKINATKVEKKYANTNYKKKTVFVVNEQGIIPLKIAEQHFFGVNEVLRDPNASSSAKVVAAVGGLALTLFTAKVLGMHPPVNRYGYYDPVRARAGYDLTSIATNEISIGFELPKIVEETISLDSKIEIMNNNKLIKHDFVLINPLGEIASEAIDEHSSSLYKKLIFRLATKNITAIVASYGTYKAIKDKTGEFFAKIAALAQFAAASKIIKNSEQADLRFWGLLPKSIQMTAFEFDKYDIKTMYVKKMKRNPLVKSLQNNTELIYINSRWISRLN